MDYNHLEAELPIDRDNLDEIVERHPVYFHAVCERLNDARGHAADMKGNLAQVGGLALAKWREEKNPASGRQYSLDDAKGLADQEDDVVDAKAAYQSAVSAVGRWEGLKESYLQRSYSLRLLGDLWLGQYWTGPTVRGKEPGVAKGAQAAQARTAMAAKRKQRSPTRKTQK